MPPGLHLAGSNADDSPLEVHIFPAKGEHISESEKRMKSDERNAVEMRGRKEGEPGRVPAPVFAGNFLFIGFTASRQKRWRPLLA